MGRTNGDMLVVTICQELHWTYEEYLRQPTWFLTLLREKMQRDAKAQEIALRKARHG